MAEWTHKKLVRKIAAWLKYNAKYHRTIVVAELAAGSNTETPDVIGWSGCHSIMVECKTSRADFFADSKKCFRREEERGMGDIRFFAAPKGVLTSEDMPEGWGLLLVDERCVRVEREPTPKKANKDAEVIMLVSAIRRLEISTAVYVVQDSDTENQSGLGTGGQQ